MTDENDELAIERISLSNYLTQNFLWHWLQANPVTIGIYIRGTPVESGLEINNRNYILLQSKQVITIDKSRPLSAIDDCVIATVKSDLCGWFSTWTHVRAMNILPGYIQQDTAHILIVDEKKYALTKYL
jgi:hypothetical protein